jgi:hypothetical protein
MGTCAEKYNATHGILNEEIKQKRDVLPMRTVGRDTIQTRHHPEPRPSMFTHCTTNVFKQSRFTIW